MSSLQESYCWVRDLHLLFNEVRQKAFNQPIREMPEHPDPYLPRVVTRDTTIEAATKVIINDINIKVSQLIQKFDVETESHEWDLFIAPFVNYWLFQVEKCLWDKFLLGLGWLAYERVKGLDDWPRLTYVDSIDMVWDPEYWIDRSPRYWRRIRMSAARFRREFPELVSEKKDVKGNRLDVERLTASHIDDVVADRAEKADRTPRALPALDMLLRERRLNGEPSGLEEGSGQDIVLWVEYSLDRYRIVDLDESVVLLDIANPCKVGKQRFMPCCPMIGPYPGGVDQPFSDWEFCYSQQAVIDEISRSLLDFWRKSFAVLAYPEGMISPNEKAKLTQHDKETVALEYNLDDPRYQPGSIHWLVSPGLPPGLMESYTLHRQYLNDNSGVTDFDRQQAPEGVDTATEASLLANAGARRAKKEQLEMNLTCEWIVRAFCAYTRNILRPKDFTVVEGKAIGPETVSEMMQPPKLEKGLYRFMTQEGPKILPVELPAWVMIRDTSYSVLKQQQAMALLGIWKEYLGRIPIDPESLMRHILGKGLGMTAEDIASLLPKMGDASSPMPALMAGMAGGGVAAMPQQAEGTAPMPQGMPQGSQPDPQALLSQLLAANPPSGNGGNGRGG